MHVRLSVTVDVDMQAWVEAYGVNGDPNDLPGAIRRDVKAYLATLVEDSAARREELFEIVRWA